MKSLLQISGEMESLAAGLEENGGELTPEVEAWLASLQSDTENKIDAYYNLIREFELRAEAAGKEAARFQVIQKVRANAAEQLKARLLWFMQNHKLQKIQTAARTVSLVNNGGVPPIELLVEVNELPMGLTINEPHADMREIRKRLESGDEDVEKFARMKERGQHLRFS